MVNEEIGGHIERFQRCQQDRCPAVVGDAGARIRRRVVGVIGVGVFALDCDHADLDGRVHRLHLIDVVFRPLGIAVGVVWTVLNVTFPRTIVFVADFPIFEAETFRHIGIPHPLGGFLRCAAAVIDGDEGLSPRATGDIGKRIKIACPLPVIAIADIGLPMIAIRRRTAWKAQDFIVNRLQKGDGFGGVECGIPDGRIDGKHPVVHHAHDLAGIYAEIDAGRWRQTKQRDVVHIERGLSTAAAFLQPKPRHTTVICNP